MKKHIVIALLGLILIPIAQADGPPVREDGTITTKHIAIKINPSQIEQVEKTHIINLTPYQHSVLKKYYSELPKEFVVVTPHHNDCTCDLIYLIWNKRDTIVLSLNGVNYFKELLDNKENPYDYSGLLRGWTKQKIIIDTKGNVYFRTKKLNRTELEDLFDNIAKEKDEFARWIAVSLPPYLNTEYESKVNSAIKKIMKIANKYKVKAQIGG